MYIVGTSGHIDHGKTSLIQALTGIDCDRLPEEKERGMTIDIGFASIDYPRFGTVSIIDVPGHERFIRNMVAGAWGMDLGLLVVAADDGWMPQTEDHFRVLELLGVEKIVVVINKADLADAETLEIVESEIKEKLENTRFSGSDIARVSSKTGQGIAGLKDLIVANLRKLSGITDSMKPYLFVDRVFASKGYGTVATGTLKNGVFHENDTVHILPVKKEVRIKKIESHFHSITEGNPSQRTALNLAGADVEDLHRGSIIIKHNFFTESSDAIVSIRLLGKKKNIKNNLGIEVLIGTASLKGRLILLEEGLESAAFSARIKFDGSWFFYPGQPFILTSPGGYRIIGGGHVLLSRFESARQKRGIKELLTGARGTSPEELIELSLAINKFQKRDFLVSSFPQKEGSIDKILTRLAGEGRIVAVDGFLLSPDFHKKSLAAVSSAVKENLGLNQKEIADHAGLDTDLSGLLIRQVMKDEMIIEKEGRYFSGAAITEDTLTDAKKKILGEVLRAGGDGIEIDRAGDDKRKKEIGELIRLEFLVSLDGTIIYHRDIYSDLKSKIIKLFDGKDKISVSEAKDAAGLSRKYILPLLNRIEREGLIKRLGDFRIKT